MGTMQVSKDDLLAKDDLFKSKAIKIVGGLAPKMFYVCNKNKAFIVHPS
jgi:hypothetical protein